jgi:hypothetical protein
MEVFFMIIIYHCVGGSHSSAVAAAIHLGQLPTNRIPSSEEIENITYFDTAVPKDYGRILHRGDDNKGNRIFTLSRQFVPTIVVPAVEDMWKIAGQDPQQLMMINTMPTVNILMKIGGFSSRRLNLVSFGRPIVIKGVQQTYKNLVNVVENVQSMINNQNQ